MTQCELVLKWLNEEGSITTFQAFTELGITRLASRIWDLRQQGYEIGQETVTKRNRFGEVVHFKKYWLEYKEEEL